LYLYLFLRVATLSVICDLLILKAEDCSKCVSF
jgi:hypothetical protein